MLTLAKHLTRNVATHLNSIHFITHDDSVAGVFAEALKHRLHKSWQAKKCRTYLLQSASELAEKGKEMQSVLKQNFHSENEGDINKLINLKLNASYTYHALGMYFDSDDVALPKFSSFFLERSVKEREQAEKLLEYQNMRGGRILLQTIAKPSREDWRGGLDAMSFSLDYQKSLNTCILDVHRRAGNHTDPHLCDFLEQHFLADSHDTIKKLGDYIASLTRITASETHGPMGEYLFDKHTL